MGEYDSYEGYAQGKALQGSTNYHVGTISRNILANQAREDAKKKAKEDKLSKLTEFDLSKAQGLYPMWAKQYIKANTDFVKQVYRVADEQGIDAAERYAREKAPALAGYNTGLFTNNNTFKATEENVAKGGVHEGNIRDMSAAARNENTTDEQWSSYSQQGSRYGLNTGAGYAFSAQPRKKGDVMKIFKDANKSPDYSKNVFTKGSEIDLPYGKKGVWITPVGEASMEDVAAGVKNLQSSPDDLFDYEEFIRPTLPASIKEDDYDIDPNAKLKEYTKFAQSVMSAKGEQRLIESTLPQPTQADKDYHRRTAGQRDVKINNQRFYAYHNPLDHPTFNITNTAQVLDAKTEKPLGDKYGRTLIFKPAAVYASKQGDKYIPYVSGSVIEYAQKDRETMELDLWRQKVKDQMPSFVSGMIPLDGSNEEANALKPTPEEVTDALRLTNKPYKETTVEAPVSEVKNSMPRVNFDVDLKEIDKLNQELKSGQGKTKNPQTKKVEVKKTEPATSTTRKKFNPATGKIE